jgi:hypothetical protein
MLKYLSGKIEFVIFAILVVVGVGGYFGWNLYSERYQVKAFSFDPSDIVDDAFYAAYKAYMAWVDDGVKGGSNNKLKTELKSNLQPFYKNNLSDVRFAYTTRFDDLGMTDCERIYFGNKEMVDNLKAGKTLTKSQLRWLAHELEHTEQCNRVGGRKKYSIRWFKQVKNIALLAIKSGNFKNIVSDIANAQKLAKYDDAMPMEKEADTKAETVVKALR